MVRRLLLVMLLSVLAQPADAQIQMRLLQQQAVWRLQQQQRQALAAQQDRRQQALRAQFDLLRLYDLQGRRGILVQQELPQDHLRDLQQNQQFQLQLQQQQLQQTQQLQQQLLLQQHLNQQQPLDLPQSQPPGLGR